MLSDIDRIEELKQRIADAEIKVGIPEMRADIEALTTAVNDYALEHDGLEHPHFKLTRVQAHKRVWNIDKLEKILPRAAFRKVVTLSVDNGKLDDLVRAGGIDRKKIEPAFEETPNKPFVKWTPVSASDGGAEEADSLAAKLG